MSQILIIDSSPLTQNSQTKTLTNHIYQTALTNGYNVTRRDVGQNPPPHLDEALVTASKFVEPEARTEDQNTLLLDADQMIQELKEANILVIGSPMYNFTITSGLKSWIDHVARARETFKYSENGPEGLLKNKKVYLIVSRGGNYAEGSPAAAMDFQVPYLKSVLGFLGLTDIELIAVEGSAMGQAGFEAAYQKLEETLLRKLRNQEKVA